MLINIGMFLWLKMIYLEAFYILYKRKKEMDPGLFLPIVSLPAIKYLILQDNNSSKWHGLMPG